MEAAWDVVRGQDGDVVIGIVDGGTDWQHEDLRANVWVNSDEVFGNGVDDDNNGYVDDVNGWNFANDSAKPTGMEGTHGIFQATAVAGIAAAVTNNGAGIAGDELERPVYACKRELSGSGFVVLAGTCYRVRGGEWCGCYYCKLCIGNSLVCVS